MTELDTATLERFLWNVNLNNVENVYCIPFYRSSTKRLVILYPESQVTSIQRLSGYNYDAGH